tara:strand:+ start:9818 stop:10216 length:399 start_codon:yes stop_codon:yes gene_type:complete
MLIKDIKPIKKECKDCGKMKLHEQFATASWRTLSDGTRKHYRRKSCSKCYYKSLNAKRRAELREWYLSIKNKQKCVDCGYDRYPRALEYHHTEDNKSHNVSDMIGDMFSKAAILKEMSKCIVLCVRCHAERH